MSTLGSLEPDELSAMAYRYFLRAGLGTEIGGGRGKLARAVLLLQATNRYSAFNRIVGLLCADALGEPPPMSANTAIKYRKIIRSLGLTPADLMFGDGPPIRLDYPSGRAVSGTGNVPNTGNEAGDRE